MTNKYTYIYIYIYMYMLIDIAELAQLMLLDVSALQIQRKYLVQFVALFELSASCLKLSVSDAVLKF